MKKLLSILLLACSVWANAQIMSDDYRAMADLDLIGTSRYVGMAGAMGAVGGDPSAAGDNPAGWAIYRRNEISVTFDYQNYRQPEINYPTRTFSCGQASWNFCFLKDRISGIVANNVAITYQRRKNYNREYSAALPAMQSSLMDVMVIKTDGLVETDLQGDEVWNNAEIGWLSKMGYETYLINPQANGSDRWAPANMEQGTANLNCIENGALDEFSFDWGINFSNRFYLGASIALQSIAYSKTTTYSELFANNEKFTLQSYVRASGIGVNASLGMIYRPAQWIRFGVAFHSPSRQALNLTNNASLRSDMAPQGSITTFTCQSPDYSESLTALRMPMRSIVGMAFQFGKKGLLSVDYDYQHFVKSNCLDTHWLKIGTEFVLASNWFVNLGYAFKCNQLQFAYRLGYSDPIREIDYYSARLETQTLNLKNANYITAGLAFRHPNAVIGLAYQCRLMDENLRMHELQSLSTPISSAMHKIVCTLAFRR